MCLSPVSFSNSNFAHTLTASRHLWTLLKSRTLPKSRTLRSRRWPVSPKLLSMLSPQTMIGFFPRATQMLLLPSRRPLLWAPVYTTDRLLRIMPKLHSIIIYRLPPHRPRRWLRQWCRLPRQRPSLAWVRLQSSSRTFSSPTCRWRALGEESTEAEVAGRTFPPLIH